VFRPANWRFTTYKWSKYHISRRCRKDQASVPTSRDEDLQHTNEVKIKIMCPSAVARITLSAYIKLTKFSSTAKLYVCLCESKKTLIPKSSHVHVCRRRKCLSWSRTSDEKNSDQCLAIRHHILARCIPLSDFIVSVVYGCRSINSTKNTHAFKRFHSQLFSPSVFEAGVQMLSDSFISIRNEPILNVNEEAYLDHLDKFLRRWW